MSEEAVRSLREAAKQIREVAQHYEDADQPETAEKLRHVAQDVDAEANALERLTGTR